MRSDGEASGELGVFARVVLWAGLSGLRIMLRAADVIALLGAPAVLGAYLRLWRARWRDSPYRLDPGFDARLRRARAGVEDRQLSYGDTPVSVAMWVLRRAGVGEGSSVLDLGAGRGHALLAARRLGARARGIELERRHVDVAAATLASVGVELEQGDVGEAALGAPTHVFIAWTLFSERARRRLAARLEALPAGTRIVTLAHPLAPDRLALRARWAVPVPWGIEQAYLQEVPDQGFGVSG